MYFTVIKYETTTQDFKLIHTEPAEVISEGYAKYVNYVQVNCKPTFDEAKTILEICATNNLTVGIKNATTVKL